jgi:DNA mismatch repair ATPase MutS
VVARARQILGELERDGFGGGAQLSLLGPSAPGASAPSVRSPLEAALAEVDPDRVTPIQALQILADLKRLS